MTGPPAPAGDRVLAGAKLTRTLRITGRRSDGYHLLESEMCSLDLADVLELSPGPAQQGQAPLEVVEEISWRGAAPPPGPLAVPLGPGNLVLRALELLGLQAAVRLVKRIPPGAGLGGGSADAAAVLRWAGVLDRELASGLGADVPFCVAGGRALVRGAGEILEPLEPEAATFLLVTPPLAVSTPAAYRAFDELGAGGADAERRNDLEQAALAVAPSLARWRDLLGEVSGLRPQLAGSGATWFVELPAGDVAVTRARAANPRGGRMAGELARALADEGLAAAVVVARATDTDGKPVGEVDRS